MMSVNAMLMSGGIIGILSQLNIFGFCLIILHKPKIKKESCGTLKWLNGLFLEIYEQSFEINQFSWRYLTEEFHKNCFYVQMTRWLVCKCNVFEKTIVLALKS